ncbi:MAG: hypothetical protein IKS90_05835 [Clostridia bacterium]|nr:hypothetical protein [Clostridia bacterium]
MKKLIAALLALLTIFTVSCHGTKSIKDTTVFDLFMKAVVNRQYSEAYSFISKKVASGSTRGSAASKTIGSLDFEELYEKLFSTFKLDSITYKINEFKETAADKRSVSYTVSYESRDAGKLDFDCEVGLIAEDGTWKVQWSPSCIFPDYDWTDTFARAKLFAKRGDILTEDGTVIAMTADLVTVYVVFSEFVGSAEIVKRIAQIEGVDEDEAKKTASNYLRDTEKLHGAFRDELNNLYDCITDIVTLDEDETPEKLFKNVIDDFMLVKQLRPDMITSDQMRRLEQIQGVHIDTKNYGTARVYPYGDMLAHNLGYVGLASESEAAALNVGRTAEDGLYTTDSMVGKTGVEKLYEKELRGTDGFYYFLRNADGSLKKELYRKDRVNGVDVHLTINFDLQKRTEELLDVVLYGDDTSGAVIVMDPLTGEVVAMASYPTFDLNKFVIGFSAEEYTELQEQANVPLLDRTKRGLYPPGSTLKPFTAAAALDLGVMNENYIFSGRIEDDYWTPTGYGAWIWPRIKRTHANNRTMPMNMENCMLHSDNIYFANAALMIGAERLKNYLAGVGMDEKLPFELTVAQSQVIGRNTVMNYKMLADTGYGQGEVLVTPLQLAVMYCAFRNGGNLPTPRIIDSFYKTNGVYYECVSKTEYSPWITGAISTAAIKKLVPMLQGVVDPTKHGTGRSLRVSNVDVAAKTGSAEIGDKTSIISWFAGFRVNVEEENERVVIVMLDVPDTPDYTSLKFQIARQLLKLDDAPDPNEPPSNND